jgi:phage I-like protein
MAKRWIQIAPLGEFPHSAGVTQVVDAAAVASMAASFDTSRKVLIDFDHYSDLSNAQRKALEDIDVPLPTEAAGWLEAVEARGDGLYGLADLTPDGEAAIANADYRFLSPVWLRKDCEDAGTDRVRPMRLNKVGLTNEPNIRDIRPLVNRRRVEAVTGPLCELKNSAPVETPAKDVEPVEAKHTENVMDYKAKLIEMLGLAPDADDAAIEAALAAMMNSKAEGEVAAKAKEDELVAVKAEKEELKNRAVAAEAAASEARVEADLAAFADVITDKDSAKTLLLANRAAAVKSFEGFRAAKLPNRSDANPPDEKQKPQLTGIDRACAAFAKQ